MQKVSKKRSYTYSLIIRLQKLSEKLEGEDFETCAEAADHMESLIDELENKE